MQDCFCFCSLCLFKERVENNLQCLDSKQQNPGYLQRRWRRRGRAQSSQRCVCRCMCQLSNGYAKDIGNHLFLFSPSHMEWRGEMATGSWLLCPLLSSRLVSSLHMAAHQLWAALCVTEGACSALNHTVAVTERRWQGRQPQNPASDLAKNKKRQF
jgi:hypothetical protein